MLETDWNAKEKRRHGRNRELVLAILARSKRPLGAYELLELLREEGLHSPLQIYRALDQLVEVGKVHKIASLSAFAICAQGECAVRRHVTFAICRNCGQAREVHDPVLEQVLRRLAHREGFQTKSTTIELSGFCEACAHG